MKTVLLKRSTVKSEEQSRSRNDFVSLCGTEVPWIFIRRSLPPCFSKPCAYKCVLCMFMACVCVCTRILFFPLYPRLHTVLLIFMYLIPLWGESGFQWIAEVCFVCWNKKSKMRSFYKNVQLWHFRPSAIKDWRQPNCHIFIFFFFSMSVVAVVLHLRSHLPD